MSKTSPSHKRKAGSQQGLRLSNPVLSTSNLGIRPFCKLQKCQPSIAHVVNDDRVACHGFWTNISNVICSILKQGQMKLVTLNFNDSECITKPINFTSDRPCLQIIWKNVSVTFTCEAAWVALAVHVALVRSHLQHDQVPKTNLELCRSARLDTLLRVNKASSSSSLNTSAIDQVPTSKVQVPHVHVQGPGDTC